MTQNSGTPSLRNFPLLCAPLRLAVNSPHPRNHETHKIKKVIFQHPLVSETTQIHPDKIRAYLATDYRLGHTDDDIINAAKETAPDGYWLQHIEAIGGDPHVRDVFKKAVPWRATPKGGA